MKRHADTAAIAEDLIRVRPQSLAQLLDDRTGGNAALLAGEYLLWRHSLDATNFELAGLPPTLIPRSPSVEEMVAIDEALETAFGPLTRSPIRARLASANIASAAGSVLGATDRKSGDMIVGRFPAKVKAATRNRKILIEQMARSMLARQFWNERNAFNKWLLGPGPRAPIAFCETDMVFRGPVGPALHLREPTDENGLRTDYTDELANAMANAIFDTPCMSPKSRYAPSRQAIFYALALFKRKPVVPISYFRSLSREELERQRSSHGPVIVRENLTYTFAPPCHAGETLTWHVAFSELRDNFSVFGSTAQVKSCRVEGCAARYAGANDGGRNFRILPVPAGTAPKEVFRRLRAELRDIATSA